MKIKNFKTTFKDLILSKLNLDTKEIKKQLKQQQKTYQEKIIKKYYPDFYNEYIKKRRSKIYTYMPYF